MKNKPHKTLPLAFEALLEHCACFRGELTLLAGVLTKYQSALDLLRAEHMPVINVRAQALQYPRNRIWKFIVDNRPLFKKPRTRTFSDIKVGLQKQPGRIEIANKEQTIERIKKHCPERLDDLAPATREIRKEAFAHLPADLLKKLGVTVTADTDAIIIKPMDSDVEKAVAALLKEIAPELKAAA
jgi:hypothetical protein